MNENVHVRVHADTRKHIHTGIQTRESIVSLAIIIFTSYVSSSVYLLPGTNEMSLTCMYLRVYAYDKTFIKRNVNSRVVLSRTHPAGYCRSKIIFNYNIHTSGLPRLQILLWSVPFKNNIIIYTVLYESFSVPIAISRYRFRQRSIVPSCLLIGTLNVFVWPETYSIRSAYFYLQHILP